jgi:hypothetical protein
MSTEPIHGETNKQIQEISESGHELVLGLLVSQIILLLLCLLPSPSPHHPRAIHPASLPASQVAWNWNAASPFSDSSPKPQRTVFPYSVIPGGVTSARELGTALKNDPVAASHYSNFQVNTAHVIRLASERHVYVSYRFAGHIFWTRKKVTLHAGETLLSDGSHLARTRCGNRVSEVPAEPVSPAEPAEQVMNNPVTQSAPETSEAVLPPPIWSARAEPLLPEPGYPEPGVPNAGQPSPGPIPCCGVLPTPNPPSAPPHPLPQPPPVPLATPEPGSFLLLFLGLAALLVVTKFRRP